MVELDTLTPMLAGTQCTRCGYDSCRAYAEALLDGAPANLCTPGGEAVARRVAVVLERPYLPPAATAEAEVAAIREADCIGCTLCIQKCPTDAIVGAPKQLHTVLPDMCTGCGVCVPACPAACIDMQPAPHGHALSGVVDEPARAAVWQLVHAAAARAADAGDRGMKLKAEAPRVELAAIGGDLAAKIAAAREKSAAKYAAKGPLKTPKVLREH